MQLNGVRGNNGSINSGNENKDAPTNIKSTDLDEPNSANWTKSEY